MSNLALEKSMSVPWVYCMKCLVMVAVFSLLVCMPQHGFAKEEVVATVDGADITRSRFDQVIEEYKQKIGKDALTAKERARLLNNIILRELILKQPYIAELKKDPKIRRKVNKFEEDLLVAGYLDKEIGSKLTVTDQEMKQYYQKHPDQFKTKKKVSARVILLKTRKEAENIRSQLKAGADFSELARKVSIDMPTASKGGSMGVVEKGKTFPEIEQVLFNLKQGEISEIVETQFGFNIFTVDTIYPETVQPYDEVKDKVKKRVLRLKEAKAFSKMEKSLEKNADITILDKSLTTNKKK